MNKIIRFASVIAIACASLVYAGCTKDFSSDIARLEGEKATKADVEKVNAALEAFKTEATAQLADLAAKKADKTTVEALQSKVADLEPIVTANKTNIATLTTTVGTIDAAVKALQADYARDIADLKNADTKIADDAAKALENAVEILNTEDKKLSESINTLKSDVEILDKYVKETFDDVKKEYKKLDEDQQKLIDGLTEDLAKLTARVDDLEDAVATLQSQMKDVLAMVQSLSFIPDKKGQAPVAYTFVKETVTPAVTGAGQEAPVVAKAVFQTSFQVTPKEAAGNINVDNLKIRVVGKSHDTKAFATEANDTLIKVTSVKVNEKTGYIDVIGAFDWKKEHNNTLSVVAIYEQKGENDFQENISTSVFPIEVNQHAKQISHVFAVNGKASEDYVAETIVVTPSTKGDLKKAIFGDEKYEIYAQAVLGKKDTLVGPFAELAALIGADEAFLKPAKGDTTYNLPDNTWSINEIKKFKVDTNCFATKVDPDTTVLAILKASHNEQVVYTGSISIRDGSTVTGKYVIKPDEVKEDLGNKATIAWNWNKATTPLVDGIVIEGIKPNDVDKFKKVVGTDYANEIKITDKAGKEVAAECVISWADSKTFNAKVTSETIEYGKADSTYVVTITNKEIPGTIYTLAFEFTVKARPADKDLDFGKCDTLVLSNINNGVIVKNDFSKQLFEYIKSVNDSTIADTNKNDVIANAGLPTGQTGSYIAADSTVVLAKDLKYGKEIVIKDTLDTDYGFKVRVKHTIKINTPALTLNPVTEYVDGTGKHDYKVEVKSYIAEGKYTIDYMPFQQYLTVKGNDKGYAVKAKIHADSSQVVNGSATLALENGKKDIFASNVMKWGDLDTTSFKLGVALVTDDEEAVLDTATIEFWTKDPLSPMTAKDTAVVQKIGGPTEVALNSNKIIALTGLVNEKLIKDNGELLDNYSLSNLNFDIVEYSSDEAKNFVSIVEGNTFTLDQNHGTLTKDATFKIKATVDYIFGKKEATFNVTIKPAK